MMESEIGSDNWLETNNAILGSLPEVPGDFVFGIEILDGTVTRAYSLIIEGGSKRLESGIAETCPVRLKIAKPVADQLHNGTRSVADAISNGEIKISGHADTLIGAGEILSVLSKALQNSR